MRQRIESIRGGRTEEQVLAVRARGRACLFTHVFLMGATLGLLFAPGLFAAETALPARSPAGMCAPAETKSATPDVADEETEGRAATAVVRKMLAALRLNKFDHALKYVGLTEMVRFLMDKHYSELSDADRQRFQTLLGEYIKKRAFPMANQHIGKVGLSYDKPSFKDSRVHIKSSIVFSGAERLVFTWILQKQGGEYQVVDFLNAEGQSSLAKSRDTQILPVYRKRGAKGLLDTLERAVKNL